MKKAILILTLLFSATSFAQGSATFLIVQSPPKNNFENRLLTAKDMALEALINFKNNPVSNYQGDSDVRNTLDMMLTGLDEAALSVKNPKSSTPQSCINNVMYIPFIPTFQNSVRVCDLSEKLDLNQLYQSMLHESFHISEGKMNIPYDKSRRGLVESEALATVYEFSIMNTLHKCLYLDSPYYSDKKSSYDDVKSYIVSEYNIAKPNLCPGYKNKQKIIDSNLI